MADIAEKRDMIISLLPKKEQGAIEAYEKKIGQNMEKSDIQWKGWQQKLCCYLNEKREAYGKQEKIRRYKSEDSMSEDFYSD